MVTKLTSTIWSLNWIRACENEVSISVYKFNHVTRNDMHVRSPKLSFVDVFQCVNERGLFVVSYSSAWCISQAIIWGFVDNNVARICSQHKFYIICDVIIAIIHNKIVLTFTLEVCMTFLSDATWLLLACRFSSKNVIFIATLNGKVILTANKMNATINNLLQFWHTLDIRFLYCSSLFLEK